MLINLKSKKASHIQNRIQLVYDNDFSKGLSLKAIKQKIKDDKISADNRKPKFKKYGIADIRYDYNGSLLTLIHPQQQVGGKQNVKLSRDELNYRLSLQKKIKELEFINKFVKKNAIDCNFNKKGNFNIDTKTMQIVDSQSNKRLLKKEINVKF